MEIFNTMIASALQIAERRVANTLELLAGGATIPFISRYRKEATGGLDEVQIEQVKQMYEKLTEVAKRKETILATIDEQGKLTPELKQRITASWDATELEDIYLPFKPKRKTRAEVARQRGLEPLADLLMMQREANLMSRVRAFVKGEVKDEEEALKGARDIIAERVSEDERARNQVRNLFSRTATITSKVVKEKEEEGQKFRDYFDWSEPLKRCTSHRLLALRRGEAEGILKVTITPDDEECKERLMRMYVKGKGECSSHVDEAVSDSYKRLLKPSIETEFAALSKEKADVEAIRIFAENLKQLLLSSPLGQKRVLGIDPGFRTGCKLVCLDAQGTLLHHSIMSPHPPKNQYRESMATMKYLIEKYQVEAIAIGNGTAGRETEEFVRHLPFVEGIEVYSVSEDGASVYSASKIAREEFPDYDVTVRGAVSIGRRLMDPLAELVKIDPKSIGVGQYQHDVDQAQLKRSLDQVVENCVNLVGVNVNTASKHLLTYVSGLGPVLAQNIVDYRTENGPFRSRKELMKVPRMGAKAFEQCAGFLRIPQAKNPLDNSAVHPESYHIVEQMAKEQHTTVDELIKNKELRVKVDLARYVTSTVGMPTLTDIMQELDKPGLDPRKPLAAFRFADVHTLEELREGMTLPGIVTNITNFGCFVDVGVHQDGLVHISQLADKFVSDPTTVVSLRQQVMVRVLEVDLKRKRLSLTMRI
ncbi:MAG: RNA-binding transcriptional accessory protein [Bacteroidaceae bacterium]|nr:RNA-binding transcriptional accessory protein [Bacteroidaceae bacterium]